MSNERTRILETITSIVRRPSWPREVALCGRTIPPPLLSHVVSFPRIEIPVRGDYENDVEVAGRSALRSLKPGVVLFAPPHCWNRPTWRRPVRVLSVLFGQKHIGFSLVTSPGPRGGMSVEKFSVAPQLGGAMFSVIDALTNLGDGKGPAEALPGLVRSLLVLVRAGVEHPPAVRHPSAAHRLELISAYLQGHYQQDITRERVAEQFGISPNHLSRLFRSAGQSRFNEYLTHIRIDRAKFLLRHYPMRVDDVARQCGYGETAYFCRVFRRLTKCTPGQYRGQVASGES